LRRGKRRLINGEQEVNRSIKSMSDEYSREVRKYFEEGKVLSISCVMKDLYICELRLEGVPAIQVGYVFLYILSKSEEKSSS
jgi:hypothetical protein